MKNTLHVIALFAVTLVCFTIVGLVVTPTFAQDQAEPEPSWYQNLGQGLFMGSQMPLLDLSESKSLFKGLSVSGFYSNTTGMWADSSAIRYQKSKNSLAAERNWLQLDINYLLSGHDRFFVRWWGVYEPPYPFEYNAGMNDMENFYNQYTVRDAFWKHTEGPFTLFVGRQIVTWGESIAFRINDVVNPQDFSWNFGFANLEQSRLPLWMVHPIVSFPNFGPLAANFIEGIWAPAWQPMYTQVDFPNMTSDPHSNFYDGQHDVAGSVSVIAPFNTVAGARFGTTSYPFFLPTPGVPANETAYPQVTNFASPFFSYHVPGGTLGNSMEGFRLHTLIKNSEFTALYWHAHQLNPTFYVNGSPSSGQVLQGRFPELNDIGASMNRPIYLPGNFLSNVPFVFRTEAVWQDKTPFNTTDTGVRNAIVDKNTFNTLMALDLDGFNAPWLSSTGALNGNLEWNNYTISGYGKGLVYGFYGERWRHNEEQILLSLNTSWWWGAIVPAWTMIYNPDATTFLLFPNVVMTPPWTTKYFVNLQYIGILSNDKFSSFAGGTFKGKSILLMQFQYNFAPIKGSL